jgi:hypothetical protein
MITKKDEENFSLNEQKAFFIVFNITVNFQDDRVFGIRTKKPDNVAWLNLQGQIIQRCRNKCNGKKYTFVRSKKQKNLNFSNVENGQNQKGFRY